MKIVHKACPCVLRQRNGRWQVLVFRHPVAGLQIAKGTVEEGESAESASLRELLEETGLRATCIVAKIAQINRFVGGGPNETGPVEQHIWHLFHVGVAEAATHTDSWAHQCDGSEVERGLVFEFFWLDVEGELAGFHPFWANVFESLRHYVRLGPDQM